MLPLDIMDHWKESRRVFRHLRAEGKLSAARDALQNAIDQLRNPDLREAAGLHNQLAKLNLELNDPLAAEAAARRAIQAEIEFGPPAIESDHLAAYHVMLAYTLRQQGKYSQAVNALSRGIELYAQHLDLNNELITNLRELLASIENDKWRESS